MAENKKSFLIYCDIIKSIDHLTNEEKGILFQHLLEYVNDMNPVLEDRVILSSWKPIETQLKRDLVKWEEIKEKRSLAGKKSAEVRKQKATNLTSVKSVEQNSTNPTVSVSVNVNDNVSVNDILLKKETKKLFNVWLDYRKEINKPIKSEKTLVALAKKIESEGFEKSKIVINTSIENQWQGIFWNKQQTEKKEKVAQKRNAGEIIKERIQNGLS